MAKRGKSKQDAPYFKGERYRKVQVRLWRDEKFRRLSRAQPNAQTLWTYLLTAPEGVIIPGLIPMGEMALAEAMGWSVEGFRERFAELYREGLAKGDWDARLIWIPKAIHNNPPPNPNVVISWSKAWSEIPECDLKDEAARAIKSFIRVKHPTFEERIMRSIHKNLEDCFPNRSSNGMANGSPNPLANQEQYQEQYVERLSPHVPPQDEDDLRQFEIERTRLLNLIGQLRESGLVPEHAEALDQHEAGVLASTSLPELRSWSPAPLCPTDDRFDEFFRIVEDSKAWAAKQGSSLHRFAA